MTTRSTSRFLTELLICCHRDFESFYCSYLRCVMYQVVSSSSAPEWSQEFAWAFDTPPKGQKLRISCKSKNAFGKASLCLCMCCVILFGFYGFLVKEVLSTWMLFTLFLCERVCHRCIIAFSGFIG